MSWKKIGKAILFPHIALMITLVPVATVFLVYSMVFLGSDAIPSYISYVLATYTLTVWCVRIPKLIKAIKSFKTNNKYANRWSNDDRLRVNISLYVTLIWNVAYAVLQLGLGFYHSSFWYLSMAAYYISLAIMRFFLVRYTSRFKTGENRRIELKKYRNCGWIFLLMNLVLSLMIFFMVYWNRSFNHHEITTIAMAAYTFTSFTFGIINIVKYRKYDSPVYSASKAISFAAACVSMLTLESTMLTTFSDGSMSALDRKIMMGTTGGVISALILTMAIAMIIRGNKQLKQLKTETQDNGK